MARLAQLGELSWASWADELSSAKFFSDQAQLKKFFSRQSSAQLNEYFANLQLCLNFRL